MFFLNQEGKNFKKDSKAEQSFSSTKKINSLKMNTSKNNNRTTVKALWIYLQIQNYRSSIDILIHTVVT